MTKNFCRIARVILFAVLMLLPFGTRAQDPSQDQPVVLTLDKAITMALEQNRDVLIADQDRHKAEAQIGEARSGAFPQFYINGSYSRFFLKQVLFLPPNSMINPTNQTQAMEIGSDNAYIGTAQISQTLFSKKLGAALDIAETYQEYSEQAFRGAKEDVTLQVKKAFYAVLLAEKLVQANRQGLDVVKANFENVQSQFRHGTAAEFDLLRAEVQLANTEPLLTSAENGLLLAANALKSILALPLETPMKIEGSFTFQEMDSILLNEGRRNALTANPILTQLSLQESMLEKNISIEKANYWPSLGLVGNYQWLTQTNTFKFSDYFWAKMLSVGISIQWSIFDGFRTSARVEQAAVDKHKIHYARLKAEEGIKIQIQAAELRMGEARKRIAGQEKNIEQAEKAVRIAQTRYKSGVGTQLELLDTQVAMTRAQTNYAQAIYDFLVARAEWQYAVGSPA
jgi:outer membrane protein TolC